MYERNHDDVHEQKADWDTSRISLVNALTGQHPRHFNNNPHKSDTVNIQHKVGSTDSPWLSLDDIYQVLISPGLSLGVDYLAFSFDTQRPKEADQEIWGARKGGHPYQCEIPVLNGLAKVRLRGNGMVGSGYVSMNPSTCLYGPRSLRIATLDETMEIFHLVMDEIECHVDLRHPRLLTRVSRIDVSTTIPGVRDVEALFDVVAVSPCTKRAKTATYRSVKCKESVRCMSKGRGGFMVYDKSLQSGQKGNWVRFESTMRRGELSHTYPTMGDLTNDSIRCIFNKYFDPLMRNLEPIQRTVIDDILSDDEHADTFVHLVGLETLKRQGHHYVKSDYWWNKKYKPFKRQYPHRSINELLQGR